MQGFHRYSPKAIFIAALFTTIAFAWSCAPTATEQHVQLTGSMMGTVYLVDSDTMLLDKSGIRVWLEGTEYSTFTDAKGNWRIDDIPVRSYIIHFTGEGFGESQITVLHFGGEPTVVRQLMLCRLPPCTPRLDSLMNEFETSYIMGEMPCMPDFKYSIVVYFFSNSPDVSREEGKFNGTKMMTSSHYTYCPIGRYDFVPGGQLYATGLDPSKTIYVVAYALGCNDIVVDSLSGKTIYPSIGAESSNVLSFKLP